VLYPERNSGEAAEEEDLYLEGHSLSWQMNEDLVKLRQSSTSSIRGGEGGGGRLRAKLWLPEKSNELLLNAIVYDKNNGRGEH